MFWSDFAAVAVSAIKAAEIQAEVNRKELEAINALPAEERLVALEARKERERLQTEERRHQEIVAAIRSSRSSSGSSGAAGFLFGLGIGAMID